MTINWKQAALRTAGIFRKACRFMPRSDISISRAQCGKWLFHALVLSTLLAHMVALAASGLATYAQRWDGGISNQGTILIAPLADEVAAKTTPPLAERVKEALQTLAAIPAMTRVTEIPATKVAEIVSPWIGTKDPGGHVPLPAVIDFQLATPPGTLEPLLQERLGKIPGLSMDFHAAWIEKAHTIFTTLKGSLYAGLVILMLAITSLMAVVSRAAIAISRRDITTLLTCGATDWYITRQILAQAGLIALRAAFVASALFFPAGVAILLVTAPASGASLSPFLILAAQSLLLPPSIAIVCAATAAATTLAFLRRPTA